ncbi:MAG TPA: hypothetical protein PKB06_10000, partial [Actinotalea sp.]|nr:hypothetical protein [Actinotalea sp.]
HWADRIGWRGYPLDFSAFLVDGGVWVPDEASGHPAFTGYPFTDGSLPAGVATDGWPCGGPLASATCTGPNGLFCANAAGAAGGCGSRTLRSFFNRRMGRAAVTLGALAGVGLSQSLLPAHYPDVRFAPGSVEPGFRSVTDYEGRRWLLGGSGIYGDQGRLAGWIVVPPTPGDESIVVWTSLAGDSTEAHGARGDSPGSISVSEVREGRPFAFLNFGARYKDDDEVRARSLARAIWSGLSPGSRGASSDDVASLVLRNPHARPDEIAYTGRASRATRDQITHLFSEGPFDLQTGLDNYARNRAHLFEEEAGAANFTYRDVMDAMELMCEVARSVPEGGLPTCNSSPGAIYSMADVGRVQSQMRCAAARLDQVAIRQVAQNVPR